MVEQAARMARVFRQDPVNLLQHLDRPERDVVQIADRRGDDK